MIKPALFNTEMVRAILEGKKTVTRRAVKQQPSSSYELVSGMYRDGNGRLCAVFRSSEDIKSVYPNYDRGDILWVRETWTKEAGEYFYRADFDSDFLDPCETLSGGYPHECTYHPGCEGCMRGPQRIYWHPSIHMPREAARIFLRVTGVRVERLQEITESGAKAEGAVKSYPYTDPETGETAFMLDEKGTYLSGFSQIWDSTIKPKDLAAYGWDANPWVWVIEFERISMEEEYCG